MKVLIVVPALGNVYGGPSKSVVELAEAIGKRGVSIDIVATNANGSKALDFPLLTWIQKNNYRVQYFPYWNILDYKFTCSLTYWLFHHVSEYDLVHTNAVFSYPVIPAYWACRIHQIPYTVTPRGMLEPWALSYKANKKKLYYALFEKPALQKASTIQLLASTEAEGIKPLNLKAPLVVIPNGIHRQDFDNLPDPKYFYEKFPDTFNKNLILFLGRIDPKKGLDLLAPAFAQVLAKFPQSHLIVAGPDNIDFLLKVQDYFNQEGCLNAVTFTGMLTGSIKRAALSAAKVYVAPSYSEGFSMSVLEGMASGLPCVITTGCNFPEAATAKAAHVVEIDSNAIAEALIQCLQSPQEAKAMGARARELILKEYTWDKIATKLIDIYQKIINQQSLYSSTKAL